MSARELAQVSEQQSSVQVLERASVHASEWESVPASERESSESHQFRGVVSFVGESHTSNVMFGFI